VTPTNPTIGNPNTNATAPSNSQQTGPAHSVFGSGYRGSQPIRPQPPLANTLDGVIRAPDLAPALPPSVQTVPDLDAPQSPTPPNAAPQLLDPRDKTARAGSRWAVVPAQWPKQRGSGVAGRESVSAEQARSVNHGVADRSFTPTKSYEARPTATADYDDRGWKSTASF
jgi:hypothetical protein